ncbi:DUF4097 domain-containing protein [Bacillus sp. 03113]|uniref:DUF4097 family beta strand repeat-containing protein n=1 Tax=Bacillus sp. 03113 TaxID=2578211 RepID=UPI001141D637|nr:DUF4097 domain-containing protein [Bacillus sp. 03113]
MIEERKRILSMVKEGKLSIDEALILLEALEDTKKKMDEKEEKLVGELSNAVNFEEAKKQNQEQSSGSYHFHAVKGKIFDFVDSAVKKIKEVDLDFNFGSYKEIHHIFQHSDPQMKDIEMDIANGKIQIIPWDQPDVRVECQAKVYRVDTQEEARQRFLKDIIFSIEGNKLRFATQQKWMKIEALLYIPQTHYESMKIRMFNGTIDCENLKVDQYKAKTANGKISLGQMTCQKAEVETANGQVNISNSKIKEVEGETINGAIHLDGDFHQALLQSFNGNITCFIKGKTCEIIDIKTTTGNIDVSVPNIAVNGELKSTIGSFDVNLEGIQIIEEKSEIVQKLLRFSSIVDSANGLKLLVDSKTGSIKIRKLE